MLYSRTFFATRLGASALVSIAAMVGFVLFAAGQQGAVPAEFVLVGLPFAHLA